MSCQLVEIFKTQHGSVHQCNLKNVFRLEFGGHHSFFKISDFLDFIKRVNQIDIAEMAKNMSRNADIAILMPHYTERCFLLTITDILNLREILNGAKFMVQLNSIIRECLHSLV
ncbi:hypothetical protein [Desertivirga xinjiangensis]|uniref:hypothetical protein n=1 Tax=Desertivirga xinjiangensis TaxID=539206 RepID=UPI00210E7CC3|nr:hypothetical protein [Pedobacter xinjiangensis]